MLDVSSRHFLPAELVAIFDALHATTRAIEFVRREERPRLSCLHTALRGLMCAMQDRTPEEWWR